MGGRGIDSRKASYAWEDKNPQRKRKSSIRDAMTTVALKSVQKRENDCGYKKRGDQRRDYRQPLKKESETTRRNRVLRQGRESLAGRGYC